MAEWIEVLSTNEAQFLRLTQENDVNPLAVEDCLHRDQRPKLDDYGTHQLLVWFLLADQKVFELQFLIFPDKIILVPHDPPPNGSTWREYLKISEQAKDLWHLLFHALDKACDITWIELRALFSQMDDFEQQAFQNGFKTQRLLKIKKKINEFEFALNHLGSVTSQILNLANPKDDLLWKFRDLHDHCERISQSLAYYRTQITTTIELHWGMQAQRTNLQIKRLTLLASIMMPLSFWTSFWGMNFNAIPFDRREVFYSAIAIMLVSVAGVFYLLVRKGYWSD